MFCTVTRSLKLLSLLIFAHLFIACGGGSGPDTDPNPFNFDSQTGVAPGIEVTSNSITVSGISKEVSISVSGGEYSVNGGAYLVGSSTVEDGDRVTVRVTSSSEFGGQASVNLTISEESATFTVTTSSDSTPPSSDIVFPSQASLTEGANVTVRGSANDDMSRVSEIYIQVSTDEGGTIVDEVTLEAGESEDFASGWSATVDLAADAVNRVSVFATDSVGNQQMIATVVDITQDSSGTESNYPVGNQVYWGESVTNLQSDIDLDGRQLLIGPSTGDPDLNQVYSLDIDTGVRSMISPFLPEGTQRVSGVYFDDSTTQLYFVNSSNDEVGVIDLNSDQVRTVSESCGDRPEALTLNSEGTTLYVVNGYAGICSVNVETGEVTQISDEMVFPEYTSGIYFDEPNNRLLTLDLISGDFIWVDASSGEFDTFVEDAFDPGNGDSIGVGLEVVGDELYYVDSSTNAIYRLDLTSEENVLVASTTYPEGVVNSLSGPLIVWISVQIDLENSLGYLMAGRRFEDSVWVYLIDLQSGERVLLTRSISPPV